MLLWVMLVPALARRRRRRLEDASWSLRQEIVLGGERPSVAIEGGSLALGGSAGEVVVYVKDGSGGWNIGQRLAGPAGFGRSLGLSSRWLAVGANDAVLVYERLADDAFRTPPREISGDGRVVAVDAFVATTSGSSVLLYDATLAATTEIATTHSSITSLATEGDRVACGGNESFATIASAGGTSEVLQPPDNDGRTVVAIATDIAVLGAPSESANRGAAYAYRDLGDRWQLAFKFLGDDPAAGHLFGRDVSVVGGDLLLATAPSQPALYVFRSFDDQVSWVRVLRVDADATVVDAALDATTGDLVAITLDDASGDYHALVYEVSTDIILEPTTAPSRRRTPGFEAPTLAPSFLIQEDISAALRATPSLALLFLFGGVVLMRAC